LGYGADQARFLHDQLSRDAVCLTNLPDIHGIETLPLQDLDLIGWWAKMELFNPDGPLGNEDLFYIDLDTVIAGDITPLMAAVRGHRNMVMLSDFYHPEHPASGLMFIPARVKARIWRAWCVNPYWFMVRHRPEARRGDQGFIAEYAGQITRWDELCPGAVVSYKKHIATRGMPGYTPGVSIGDGTLPAGAVIVAFHGNPRPWDFKPCKPSSSATIPASSGLDNSKRPSPVQPPSSTTPTKAHSKATSRRSKSRVK
jgi:hypothetical protein